MEQHFKFKFIFATIKRITRQCNNNKIKVARKSMRDDKAFKLWASPIIYINRLTVE